MQGQGVTYVHGWVCEVHEQHKGGGSNGSSLLQTVAMVHMDVDMKGSFQLLVRPLDPRLLSEAHLLSKDRHYGCSPLCSTAFIA